MIGLDEDCAVPLRSARFVEGVAVRAQAWQRTPQVWNRDAHAIAARCRMSKANEDPAWLDARAGEGTS